MKAAKSDELKYRQVTLWDYLQKDTAEQESYKEVYISPRMAETDTSGISGSALYRTVRTVPVCCESCIEDGGRASGRDWSGRSAKQPSFAVVKSYGSERRRKSP